jgi:5-methylcytosine-specific restriction endonuclease McrA
MSNTKRPARRNGGGKWCHPTTRLAIYLRDGLACAYCGATVEDGAILSLDHLTPHSLGGGNDAKNLVTACKRCNSSRGNRRVAVFARAVAQYLGGKASAVAIRTHVRACARRPLPRAEALEMLRRRGTVAACVA